MSQGTARKGGEGIDWPFLHSRLEALKEAIQEDAGCGARSRQILKERAAALAVVADAGAGEEERVSVLEFQLSGESYAVATSFVTETFPLSDFTPLFCTPPFVLGITNLRGRIISIVDLRRFFELPTVGLSNLNRVILVGDGTMEFGILADSIEGIRELAAKDLQPPMATLTGIREEFLVGVTAGRLALLDMAKILTDQRVVVQEEVE